MTLYKFFLLAVGCLRNNAVTLLAAFTLAASSGFAFGQPDQSAVPDQGEFRACRGIADNNARLACYDGLGFADEQVETGTNNIAPEPEPMAATQSLESALPPTAAPTAPSTPATTQAAAPAPAAMASVTTENFGAAPPRLETNAQGEAELVATVTGVEELRKGKLRISLSNGQLWLQSISKSFFLRERDTVRISRSPWGGTFRLHKDGKPGYIQVERLR